MTKSEERYEYDGEYDGLEGTKAAYDLDGIEAELRNEDKPLPRAWTASAHLRTRYGQFLQGEVPASLAYEDQQDPEKLIPRLYQLQLFEKAKKGNIIAVLDTGTGKTLIAILLIKWMNAQEEQWREEGGKKRLTFFLVPLVALVQQQAIAIRVNCPMQVGHVSGQDNVDVWDEHQWEHWFSLYDVCVVTVDILLGCLDHGFLHMDEINLIIFDEAHHAKRDHSSARIMRNHYFNAPPKKRPRILGMTASPVDSKSSIETAGTLLEATLDAQIFTASQAARDAMRALIAKPKEIIVLYDPSPLYPATRLLKSLGKKCGANEDFSKAILSAVHLLNDLGPWCSDRTWQSALEEYDRKAKGLVHGDLMENVASAELEDAVQIRQMALIEIEKHPLKPLRFDKQYLSPKVLSLISILESFRPIGNQFCGIIFVQRRIIASVLQQVLMQSSVKDFVKAEAIIGHGLRSEADTSMSWKSQVRILHAFRRGLCNLLVATSVVEEGLDVQPCNVIIRFDLFDTQISYIQSRGRARAKDSKYICMIERGNRQQFKKMASIPQSEFKMIKWIEGLSGDRLASTTDVIGGLLDGVNGLEISEGDEDEALLLDNYPCHREPSTGALLTFGNSIALLHYYCSTLPTDSSVDTRPIFTLESNFPYVMKVDLPSNAAIQSAHSGPMSSQRLSKCSVAFNACLELRKLGVLDEHLLPPKWERDLAEGIREIDEHGLVVGQRKSRRLYGLRRPAFWQRCISSFSQTTEQKLYVTCVAFHVPPNAAGATSFRHLALLTAEPLPKDILPSTIYITGQAFQVTFSNVGSISIDSERLTALHGYTMRLLSAIVNKPWQCRIEKVIYFVAPFACQTDSTELSPEKIVWEEVYAAAYERTYPINDLNETKDSILIDLGDIGRRYFAVRVRSDLNPLSSPPSEREEGFPNILAWYTAHAKRLECKDTAQSLVEVERIPHILNYTSTLASGASKAINTRTTARFVIPEFARRYSVKASVFRSAQVLPSLLRHLDHFLLALELNNHLNLSVRPEFLVTAISCPSACLQTDYERFEFLGDSMLKLIATMRIMACNPHKHEGELHCVRLRVVSNRALYKQARDLDLPSFIQSHGFVRALWRPPNFSLPPELNTGIPAALREHTLGDKTVADVAEAIVGAAFVSGGMAGGFKALRAVGVELDPFQEYDDFHVLTVQAPRGLVAGLQQGALKLLEEKLGYTFEDKRYLVEALTHSSIPGSSVPCYQRLEHLGDALLDWSTVRYLFSTYPERTPGQLSMLKGSMVTNKILGALCHELELERFVSHTSSVLYHAMKLYGETLDLAKELEMESSKAQNRRMGEWWLNEEPPKVMADIIESLLGAVFLDSRCKVQVSDALFAKWVEPFISTYVTPETVRPHPVALLMHLVQDHPCLDLELETDTTPVANIPSHELDEYLNDPSDRPPQLAQYRIHGIPIGEAARPSIKLARSDAAKLAYNKLKAEPLFLQNICTCSKERTVRELERVELSPDDLIITDEDHDDSFGLL